MPVVGTPMPQVQPDPMGGVMRSAKKSRLGPARGPLILAAMLTGLAGCEATPKSGRCAFVDVDHLARPLDIAGRTLICNPKRVSAAFRDRYFPGYEWGDEIWWTDNPQ